MKKYTNYFLMNMAASTKIMLGDLNGVNEIDRSPYGFWRSFLALILALPFTLSNKYSEYAQLLKSTEIDHPISVASFLFIQQSAALLAYLTSLVVLYAICKSLNLSSRVPLTIVSLNWSSLVLTVISFPAVVFMGAIDNSSAVLPFLVLLLIIVFSLAMFNVLRLTMGIPSKSAIVYVFVLSVVEIISYFVLLGMAGL